MEQLDALASKVFYDMHCGMEPAELMAKYKLSRQDLDALLRRLADAGLLERLGEQVVVPPIKTIDALSFVKDVRAGMQDHQLLDKHGLSTDALRSTFKLLLDGGFLDRGDLTGDPSIRHEALDKDTVRQLQRYYLDFDLPIVQTDPQEIEGRVRDLSERGVGVRGIPSKIDETKTLLIRHEKFFLLKPFFFRATCRWARSAEAAQDCIAGFEIVEISREADENLTKLVRMLTFAAPPPGSWP